MHVVVALKGDVLWTSSGNKAVVFMECMCTFVLKGDVLRTSSGGTAVVFTEVEMLKQKSPGDRKRRSPPLMPEDFDGEWTDSEERCRIAIEGHGNGTGTK